MRNSWIESDDCVADGGLGGEVNGKESYLGSRRWFELLLNFFEF